MNIDWEDWNKEELNDCKIINYYDYMKQELNKTEEGFRYWDDLNNKWNEYIKNINTNG